MSDTTQRGFLVPRITEVMTYLQGVCPPYYYPVDNDRTETPYSNGWVRGGTSPSGDSSGAQDPGDANWWIGWKYKSANYGQPQRIVWLPPERGRERIMRPDKVGHANQQTGGQAGGGGDPAGTLTIPQASRVVPVTVDIWGNDYDDTELLVHWLTACLMAVNPGAAEALGLETVSGGGWVEDETRQRGLVYHLDATFVFPIVKVFTTGGSGLAVPLRGVQVQQIAARPVPPTQPFPPSSLDESPWVRKTWIREPVPPFPPSPTADDAPIDFGDAAALQGAVDVVAFTLYTHVLDQSPIGGVQGPIRWAVRTPLTQNEAVSRLAAACVQSVTDGQPLVDGAFTWLAPIGGVQDQIDRLAYLIYTEVLDGQPIP